MKISSNKRMKRDKNASTCDEKNTIITTLKRQGIDTRMSHTIVYTFLDDHGNVSSQLTRKELHDAAKRVASTLQSKGVVKGDRVILCYPPGIEFAIGFWGTLYAGAIAIPTYPPYPGTLAKDLPKFNKMCTDSGAKVALTNSTYHMASKMATLKGYLFRSTTSWPEDLTWITTDNLKTSEEYVPVEMEMDDIAFFQYSSGSTSDPKAIMISYRNLQAQMKTWDSIQANEVMVSWLPSYHDMGLVGFIIVPIITQATCISMSPISFIKDPALWMRTVSTYSASHVCAPNFAYALAARKTSDTEANRLNLSTLKQAICAAEPIRGEALCAFTKKFKTAGFQKSAFNCGYGLAETTLVCTGQDPNDPTEPVILCLDKVSLEADKMAVNAKQGADNTVSLVGCGKAAPTFHIEIVSTVDKNNTAVLHENQVGEIWVSGPSVAVGYWGKPELSRTAFHATLSTSTLKYLRTGDLGFLRNGELFITGRLKDLIIIRGRNVCPQDVEYTVEMSHEQIRPGCIAAFSIEQQSGIEALVVVAEVRNKGISTELLNEIQKNISTTILREHQLSCHGIVLLNPRSIPKTTSGKIQRHQAKIRFLNETLSVQHQVVRKEGVRKEDTVAVKANQKTEEETAVVLSTNQTAAVVLPAKVVIKKVTDGVIKSPEEIEAWLMAALEREASTEGDASVVLPDMNGNTPWADLGMDSIALVSLSAELGEWLGDVMVPPSAFFEYTTPHSLATAPGLATGELELTMDQSASSMANSACHDIVDVDSIPKTSYEISSFPEYTGLKAQMDALTDAGLEIPYLQVLTAKKRQLVNFNTYNYLGLASHPKVAAASKAAIDVYGTSMSSSPIVGQTQINDDLEKKLCSFYTAEAAIMFVGGWVSNVATIDALVGKGDLIVCDALNHNSVVTGQRLSGATIVPFPHNDVLQAEKILNKLRTNFRRTLIIIEGVYSMDGDVPDLPAFVALKEKYKCMLFLDEAHSFGTMGKTGRGLCEHFNLHPNKVDIRMGTMSKSMGSTGGFILGSSALITYLKYCCGGFVFSVGLTPANAASALASLNIMSEESNRVVELQNLASYFFDCALDAQLDIGSGVRGTPVVVVHVGSTEATVALSHVLSLGGFDVKPIVYPAVEEGKCRLRFFLSMLHTKKKITKVVSIMKKHLLKEE